MRIKLIQQNDLGNGIFRFDFAWGVEKVDFCGNFEVGGHKKGVFFGLIYSASRGIRVLAPDGRAAEFCARPHFDSLSGSAL